MTRYVEFPLDEGGTVMVEVDEAEGGLESIGRGSGELAERTLQASLDKVKVLAQAMLGQLRELSDPDELEVSFGVKLSAEFGVALAKASSEGHYAVKLTWKKSGPAPTGRPTLLARE
ncbi:MAG: hypothetical protein JXA74_11970 [Anaerolineae bacterium]|nr:hypothetical protein [Anaerolineae bacterium]